MSNCEICGEPMPEGEEMFKFHGYSGDCPKPPLPKKPRSNEGLVKHLRQKGEHEAADRIEALERSLEDCKAIRQAVCDQRDELQRRLAGVEADAERMRSAANALLENINEFDGLEYAAERLDALQAAILPAPPGETT